MAMSLDDVARRMRGTRGVEQFRSIVHDHFEDPTIDWEEYVSTVYNPVNADARPGQSHEDISRGSSNKIGLDAKEGQSSAVTPRNDTTMDIARTVAEDSSD